MENELLVDLCCDVSREATGHYSACGKPLSARGVLMNFHFELREADKLAFSLRIPHSAEGKFLLGFRP